MKVFQKKRELIMNTGVIDNTLTQNDLSPLRNRQAFVSLFLGVVRKFPVFGIQKA